MAWPCITRACCINRFWTELDKGDIAVPLVFTRYSDVAAEPRGGVSSAAVESQPRGEQQQQASSAGAASVTRQDFRAWKVRPEPSCKPRNEYQRPPAPFSTETQYQKDYKPWPIPKKHDHPWIPKAGAPTAAAEAESGVEKSEIEEKVQEKESKDVTGAEPPVQGAAEGKAETRKGRAAADALNRHIKEVMTSSSCYRTEFKAYKDVKPAKPIKAASQYKPPMEESNLETSYSATYKGEQVKAKESDNKLLERRRIRSLYSEPGKELTKAEKPTSRTRPKKAPTATSKMLKKAKEKQISSSQSTKKKSTTGTEPKADGVVTKKSKEISNRLAEAKQ